MMSPTVSTRRAPVLTRAQVARLHAGVLFGWTPDECRDVFMANVHPATRQALDHCFYCGRTAAEHRG